MPNWCANLLTVTGDHRKRRAFATCYYDADRSFFDFQRPVLLCVPPGTADPLSQGDPGSGRDVVVRERRGSTVYRFDSPWDPPRAWLRQVALVLPRLRFHLEYADYATGMYGELQLQGGVAAVDYDRESLPGAREFVRRVFGWDPGDVDG